MAKSYGRRSRTARRLARNLGVEQCERRRLLAVTTPFTVRFTANDTGDITFAANTLMTAGPPATPTQIANVQNGIGTKLNNNDFTMTYVDIDGDASTFNSSTSQLLMPSGSEVLFAGLYWGGRTNSTFPTGLTSQRDAVKFKAPGDSGYRDLTGKTVGTSSSSYQSFYDVTAIVEAAGDGAYTVANVRSITNSSDYYAGWSLVVAYRAPGAPARNLTVFDGYGTVANNAADKTINVSVSGFKAPPSGPVRATLGFIAYEGDLGSDGDKVLFDGGLGPKQLSDASNPANNFFNSTISNRGSLVSTKNPNYVNQMGFDADLVKADGVIKNGATSATITMTTGGETYYPGVVTSAIDLFAPEVTVVKQVQDLNGGVVMSGDVLRYTVTVSNAAAALDSAVNVLLNDQIPVGTTYKPGSLVVTSGANAGAKTDAADGDQAEFLAGTNSVRFQLGTGAAGFGTSGGSLAAGQSTTVTFEVTVNAGIPPATLIENTADVTYTGATSGFNLTATASADIASAGAADLRVTKTDGKTQYVPGTTSTYTIVVTNDGPTAVTGARVVDVMPAEFSSPTWTATYSAGSSGPASGSGTIDALVNLLNGGTATFTVTAPVRPEAFGDITNTVTVAPPAGIPDPDESNNTARDTNTFLAKGTLRLQKTVSDLNGGFVQAGDVLRYTLIVRSGAPGAAPSSQEAALNVILTDLVPTNTTYKPGSLRVVDGPNAGTKTDAIDADQGEYFSGSNTVQFQLGVGAGAGTGTPVGGTLAAGGFTEVTFDVIVAAGIPGSTVITNTATVTGTGATSGLPISATDSVGIATPTAADLSIQKQAAATFTPGSTVTYIVTAANLGPSAVTGATVVDMLPAGLSGATWTATYTGGSTGPASGSGSLNATVNLANRGTARFVIRATAAADFPLTDNLTNTATVSGPAGVPDPNPGNNTSTVTTIPAAVTDLAVTKTNSQSQYVPGRPVTYTITVTNTGPSFAPQASVVDTLDPAIIASATWTAVFTGAGSSGVSSGSGSLSEIINLAPGGTAVYTVVAQTRSTATTSLVNTVTVAPSNLSNDPNPGNNTATDTDTVLLPASLTLAKTVRDLNGGFVLDGDRLRYTIVVTNQSGTPAREAAVNVTLADLIPSFTTYAGNLTFTQGSLTGSQGGGVGGTLGTLAAGRSATVTFDVTVNAGTPSGTVISNTATASGVGQVSSQPLSATDTVGVVTPPGADVAVVKTAAATYVPGSPLVYTIVVSNAGPSTSTNARVDDALPAGVTAASWSAVTAGGATIAGGSSGSGSISKFVTLPAGSTVTFTVTVQTNPAFRTAITNEATVTPTDGLPDPNPDNDRSTVTSDPRPTADLAIVKTDGVTTYTPGQAVTYTITVSNAGPSAVTGARVRDTFPAVISSATWTASITSGSGVLPRPSGTGNIDELVDLAPGAVATFVVQAITSSTATTTLTNTATVTAPADVTDPNPANDSSTDVDTPKFAPALIVSDDGSCGISAPVRVLDPVTGAEKAAFFPYEPTFKGGVRTFGYDVTGDGIQEIITAPGRGRPGEVRVFTQNGVELPQYRFFPYGPGYVGGVEVAGGPVLGVGRTNIVTAQSSGTSLVSVFDVTPAAPRPVAPAPARQFQPFGPRYAGGVTITTADMGTFAGRTLTAAAPDGVMEIAVGTGPGIRAMVNTYNAVTAPVSLVNTVLPIGPAFTGGVQVAALPMGGGLADRLLVAAGPGGGSKVETYAGVGKLPTASFAAIGGTAARAGVSVAALGATEIFNVQGTGGITGGVRKNTSPSGGVSSTLPLSTGLLPPMRISVLRS